MSLPEPIGSRWRPLRAGLVDLFYYDVEEFHFHHGSLLLRGNNGTGKSKVLALTVPFLLDGELSPHRVEPDGDRNKRMEWNLLLGGRYPHPERLGYTWLEFGRREADGTARFVTLGCGMKAATGRGIVRHWFFVTTQRIGAELSLVTPTGTALTRERLREAVAEHGLVYDRAGDYRRAVDEALFGLGPRYDALVNLLIQLRQPQLSKRPDERLLSAALTQALAPLDDNLVSQAAEAFRGLDDEREALVGLRETRKAADDFLAIYRRYARTASRRAAAGPRRTQAGYEQLGRDLGEAERAHAQASRDLTEAGRRLDELEETRQRLIDQQAALRESPEARAAENLEREARQARQLAEFAARQRAAHQRAETDRDRAADRLHRARRDLDTAAGAVATDRTESAAAAAGAHIADRHAREVDPAVAGTEPAVAGTEPTVAGTDAAVAGTDPAAASMSAADADADAAGVGGEVDLAAARSRGEALAGWRERSIRSLEGLLETAAQAAGRLRNARRRLDEITSELDAADERITKAQSAVAAAGSELVDTMLGFLAGTEELRVADAEAVLAALELWVETLDGDNPAQAAITAAYRPAAEALTRAKAAVDAALATESTRHGEVEREVRRLLAGGQDAPPAPYPREPDTRERRPGAPLWRVVDFAPEVPPADRAGIEAALEAAGLLDAWLCPDGTVLDPATHDLLLRPDQPVATSLHGPLLPAIDLADAQAGQLDEATVRRVLDAIGFGTGTGIEGPGADGPGADGPGADATGIDGAGADSAGIDGAGADSAGIDGAGADGAGIDGVGIDGAAWVAADGRFRLGVLTGRWGKDQARYIGEGAREAARRARIAELRSEIELIEARLAQLRGDADDLERRSRLLDAEHDRCPGDVALREAHAAVRSEQATRARIAAARGEAEQAAVAAAEAEALAVAAAEEFAADVDLPTARDPLAAVARALGAYQVATARLWSSVRVWQAARRAVGEAEPELTEATAVAAEAAERHVEAEQDAASARQRHQTLLDTVGTAVAELQRRLAETDRLLREGNKQIKATQDAEREAIAARGRAEGRREALTDDVRAAAGRRDEAVATFRSFAGTGLLTLACPGLDLPDPDQPWAATPAVTLARAVDRELETVDDSDRRWELVQQSVTGGFKMLADGLARHGHQAGMTTRDGMLLVDVVFQGRTQPVAGLAAALADEVTERQRILSAREREVLETHLVSEVAGTLQELIASAERQVAEMNRELEERPTSTGMRLRLVWRPSKAAPPGLAELRGRLLRQSSDVWNDDDRQRVGAFLSEQIAAQRLRDDASTWHEQLASALDYRAWHEFVIQRWADGQWRPAAGPASGGERVLAASIPLFAAASSYYGSAGNPHAPRVIALDEAFAGVDDDSRAKCLGLLARFDLDVVMTSEREWGCYPEVPGLAIAQLARHDGIEAVLVTPWRWDGQGSRYQVVRQRTGGDALVDDGQDGLFA